MKTIGFVIPWHGEDISGGAEAELRGMVHHLADAGVSVEVLTTCVKCFTSEWDTNYYKPGVTVEAGIRVRRFPVCKRNRKAFDEVNLKLMHEMTISAEEEKIFCEEMINSDALYDYLRKNQAKYSFFVFIPYMFGTTYYGSQIVPEKTILVPCFHKESYVYMQCFQQTFSRVRGMIFNSDPERTLAERLFGVKGENFQTFGIGLNTDWKSDPDRFRRKFNLKDPFILYAGRKDAGKKVDVLVNYFLKYKERNPGSLKLVLIGGGEISIPDQRQILDLGFVDVQDKYDAYGAAEVFCNPSQMESFSLVIMESWLAGTPVLVNGKCDVTRDFTVSAGGGLYYDNELEFEAALKLLLSDRKLAQRMGACGSAYVKEHFDWDRITEKYIAYFERIDRESGV